MLLSVTEGEDKPLKYPTIFNTADVAVVTKIDLAEAAGCDLGALRATSTRCAPGMRVFELSAKSGAGMDDWLPFRRPPALVKAPACTHLMIGFLDLAAGG